MGRIVSIDFGLKRIGIAISDERKIIATPLPTLETSKQNEETVKRLISTLEGYDIEEMIVGNPLHMNGKNSFLSDEVQHFIDILKKYLPYPIHLWDERLSTLQAERSLKEGNLSRKKRAKLVDSVAALILLQSFLDSKIKIDIV